MSAPLWWKRTIIRPATDFERDAVRLVQRVLMCPITGEMDPATIAHIKGMQNLFGLRPSGILDEASAIQIERLRGYGVSEDT